MTDVLPVSVVVVSRDRPDALRRCLTGLSQLRYPSFEVIVVADPEGLGAASGVPFSGALKQVPFNEPNISKARNLGISHAAGDIVAFIDDDAVPEPSWLAYLTSPFSQPHVASAGGFVRGRNGISFQYRANSVDTKGQTDPLEVSSDETTILRPTAGRAIKTEGTNMAVRRDVLVALEGFDPGFAFFLDETDLNLRLAQAGHATAIVPLAQVHHGYAASSRRRADRVPKDLFDIGASWAVFQRKHVAEAEHNNHWRNVTANERRRLLRHMVAGRLEPREVRRLMRRLKAGFDAGQTRKRGGAVVSQSAMTAFKPMTPSTGSSRVIAGRIWQKASLRRQAEDAAQKGEIITLMLLSPTALYHHCRFDQMGYWEQKGGLFGRSDRARHLIQLWQFGSRVREETTQIAPLRFIAPKTG